MTETNIPRLRFREFDGEWKEKRLDSVSNIIGGGTPSTSNSEYWNGNINWFSPVEIGNSKYVSHSLKKITSLGLKKSSAKILPKGSLLFTSRAGIGKTAILLEESSTNQGFQSIVPDKDELEIEFLYGLSGRISQYGNKMGSGSTFVEVSGKTMGKMKLSLPNFTEQKKIGKLFSKIDKLIELQTQKLEQLKKLKRGYLQKMFPEDGETSPRLRFSGFSGEWQEKKIGEFAPLESGYSFKSSKFVSDGVPIVRISNILKDGSVGGEFKFYQKSEKLSRFMLQKGSILIAMSGATVGKISLLTSNDFYLNQRVGFFNTCDDYDNYFVFQLLKTNKYVQNMNAIKVAGAQPNISKNEVDKFKFYLPDYNEQKKIGFFLSKLDQIINNQAGKIECLKQQKKSYLQRMFV